MKKHALICGVVIAAGALTSAARADDWTKRTILTVREPVQITDTVLQPGQYVLRLLRPSGDLHVVEIFNRDQSHIIDTVIAIPTQRLRPTGKTQFSFWETPPGAGRALRDWYYPGDSFGQEFAYPKHLQQMAMQTAMGTDTPLAVAAAPVSAPASAEPADVSAQTESAEQQPAPAAEQPVETAQNTAAPAQPATPSVDTPPQSQPNQPAQLPQTGSPYPAIGFAGCMLIGLGSWLRRRQLARI